MISIISRMIVPREGDSHKNPPTDSPLGTIKSTFSAKIVNYKLKTYQEERLKVKETLLWFLVDHYNNLHRVWGSLRTLHEINRKL
jgi:anaerobic ribonucleoside-triphosphate reductase